MAIENSKISIIIPVFNRFDLLKETIFSIVNQSYTNWECLLCDDGSENSELLKIKEIALSDSRIKLFPRNRLPKGRSTCRNIGIEKASGDFIIFLDSDDILLSDALTNRINSYNLNHDFDFLIFNNGYFCNNIGDTKKIHKITEKNHLIDFMMNQYPWSLTSPFWKKSFIKNYRFNEAMDLFEDPEFHIRILVDNPKYLIFECADWYYRVPIIMENYQDSKVINCTCILINSLVSLKKKIPIKLLQYFIISNIWGYLINKRQLLSIKKLLKIARNLEVINSRQYIISNIYIFLFRLGISKIKGLKRLFVFLFSPVPKYHYLQEK